MNSFGSLLILILIWGKDNREGSRESRSFAKARAVSLEGVL